ncbi:hypothetical protein DIREPILLOW8_177 [Vibrio phage Direpillow8]|uniref:Uncharacterized protein n=1 Tax=Vibrio phage Bennett TaxID=2735171 RepID=A0A6M4EV34_9CAUD|nr:hypothetical protein KNU87_gp130 [Vibrio phage Bennett]QKE61015.1 hypothetical protein DAX_178 [Vibrio phage Dax]QKN84624.1 hypothetical protein BBMUFFIN_180 [Vibrio phage BBMuffin]QKN85597.1 hypothetical protein DIREPILLOW8_177 [Vibrio phage Direpillow8]WBU76964.1 hypothetical protein KRONOS_181 [Vibrio phage Kronos]QJQ85192.1 hypothetical protein BENNETT_180 [Vibrio phage Bennett]
MKVTMNTMFESNGNYWISVYLCNSMCKNSLDTDNYVEFNCGKGIRSAVDKAAKMRKVLGTGQKLLDEDELWILVERGVITPEELKEAYADVEMMYERY